MKTKFYMVVDTKSHVNCSELLDEIIQTLVEEQVILDCEIKEMGIVELEDSDGKDENRK